MKTIINWLHFENSGEKRNLLKQEETRQAGTIGSMNNPMFAILRGTDRYKRGKTRNYKRLMERGYQKEFKKLDYKAQKKKSYGFGFGYE